ncbi:hypothetical protein FHX74_001681 [Friedmanniella endophytica]|uniref:Uncharacterized protein n=1 Tax=Microlunatus kandeliicorticis TaxID=1759536 RepID=A0A7W3IRU4_9ACTN|nr:hypothetical protein [Microlunatus kandeliicorticis]MBA8794076.1 hypothetical protein [Microlunatus kandeliicorticis]
MTTSDDHRQDDRPDDGTPPTVGQSLRARRPAPWLAVLIFAAGLLVGVLTVGLLDAGTPDFATRTSNTSTLPGRSTPTPVANGAAAQAQVNAACLAVINDAQDVYAALGDLGPALDQNDLTTLDDIVRRLQPVEPRLATDLADCRVRTDVNAGPSAPGSPVATSEPSTSQPTPSPTPTR